MYEFGGDDYSTEKKINIYLNGDFLTKPVSVKLPKKLKDIRKCVVDQFNFHGSREFRLFNEKGVELFEDDLEYIEDGISLYASKGADFDTNSLLAEYDLVKELGEGGFGKVMLGVHKKTKERVAIKILHTTHITNVGDVDQIFREAEVMESLEHQNIVKIKSCLTIRNQVVFIMEYMEGGELLERVEQAGRFSEEEAQGYFRQIVSAMEYCHRNKLIHRDLKLENILCTKLEENQEKICKVADFGIAGVATNQSVEGIDAGTLKYMAPEVLSGKLKSASPAVDIWAIGVILYCMLVGDLPFQGKDNRETIDTIIEGQYTIPKEVKKNLSKECIDIMARCFETDFTKRIRIGQLQQMDWVKDKTMENFMKKQNDLDNDDEDENNNNSYDEENESKKKNNQEAEEEKQNEQKQDSSNAEQQKNKINKIQPQKQGSSIYKSQTPSSRLSKQTQQSQTPSSSGNGGPRYAQSTKSSTFSNKIKSSVSRDNNNANIGNGNSSNKSGGASTSTPKTPKAFNYGAQGQKSSISSNVASKSKN